MKKKLLFVCLANLCRSPTGEYLFKNTDYCISESAGIGEFATIKLTQEMIDWSDIVFVMEDDIEKYVRKKFNVKDKTIISLDIPDIFMYRDDVLIELLKMRVLKYLKSSPLV